MVDIFRQRFNYAEITRYKPYNYIGDGGRAVSMGRKRGRKLNEPEPEPFEEWAIMEHPQTSRRKCGVSWVSGSPHPKKPKSKFLNFEDEGQVKMYTYNTIATTKDRHMKKLYPEPFTKIRVILIDRSIVRNGNKLTISLYKQIKTRDVNCRFFKKTKSIYRISLNCDTGNFTIVKNNKRATHIRVNSFRLLNEVFLQILLCQNGNGFLGERDDEHYKRTPELYGTYNQNLNHFEFFNQCMLTFGDEILPNQLDWGNLTNTTAEQMGRKLSVPVVQEIIKNFIKFKKIKVPNNYTYLLYYFYPTEKFLKKNNRKLVASVLDMFGYKGKSMVKLLHQNPEIDFGNFISICDIFGEEYGQYMSKIDINKFKLRKKFNPEALNYTTQTKFNVLENRREIRRIRTFCKLSNFEKNNIVKFINNGIGDRKGNAWVGLVTDHLRMLTEVREVGIDFRIKATDDIKFREEHKELDNITRLIRKGWMREYMFSDKTVKKIEKPIVRSESFKPRAGVQFDEEKHTINRVFVPVILKNQYEYDEEGSAMHHCVASYIEHQKSIIISVRLMDGESIVERVTCEYHISDGRHIQARFISNSNPPDYFDDVIESLDKKVLKLARKDKLKWIDTKRVPVKIDGIEIGIKDQIERHIRGGEAIVEVPRPERVVDWGDGLPVVDAHNNQIELVI